MFRLERLEIPPVARRLGQHDALTHDPLPLAPPHAASVALPPEQAVEQAPRAVPAAPRRRPRRPEARSGPRRSRTIAAAPARPARGRPEAPPACRRSGSPPSPVEGSIHLRRFLPLEEAQRRRSPGSGDGPSRSTRNGVPSSSSTSPGAGTGPGCGSSAYPCGDGTKASQPRPASASRAAGLGSGAAGAGGVPDVSAGAPATSSTSSTTRSISPASRSREGRATGSGACLRRRQGRITLPILAYDRPRGRAGPSPRLQRHEDVPRRPLPPARPRPGGAGRDLGRRRPTPAHLAAAALNHTSGIPDYGRLAAYGEAVRDSPANRGATRSCSVARSPPVSTSSRVRVGPTRTPATCSSGGSSTPRRRAASLRRSSGSCSGRSA